MTDHGFSGPTPQRLEGGKYRFTCICGDEFTGRLVFAREAMSLHLSYFEEKTVDMGDMDVEDVECIRDALFKASMASPLDDKTRLLLSFVNFRLAQHRARIAA